MHAQNVCKKHEKYDTIEEEEEEATSSTTNYFVSASIFTTFD